jgi:hypothetical protein
MQLQAGIEHAIPAQRSKICGALHRFNSCQGPKVAFFAAVPG